VTEPLRPSDEPSPSLDEVLADVEQEATEAPEAGGTESGERPNALDAEQANELAAMRRPTVLVLAGAVGSGKTSVYAAIYERLGRGPFGGWLFAGSRTIPGLERRCHWWRVESGSEEPFMEHTRAEDLPWLHIRLRDVEMKSGAWDLLLGDFDGEYFEQILDGRRSATELPFLRRADHVGLVVDGAKIADPTARSAEKQQASYLLGALLVPEALARPRALSVVVTKTDTLEGLTTAQRAAAETALEEITAMATERAGEAIPLVRLAVRSGISAFPLGHGLETLLELLALNPSLRIGADPPPYEPTTGLARFKA